MKLEKIYLLQYLCPNSIPLYRLLIRPIFFLFDPEKVHHFAFRCLKLLYALPFGQALERLFHNYQHPDLEQELFGLKFRNPVGLAAGFDKNGVLNEKWSNLGFGFVEVGTVTPRPQVGNPKPRMFRLPKDSAVINRMGFNNEGVEALVGRLRKVKERRIIIGGNIGKNKTTPNDQALEDYKICFEALFPHVDYFVVNVSSPNTPGLRELQEKEPLKRLLLAVQELNQAKSNPKPLLLKIAPDLTDGQLDDIVEIVNETQLDGLVATNTTISRADLVTPTSDVEAIGNGGLSGKPLTQRADEVIRYLRKKAGPDLPIIGVGGIMTPEDAAARLAAGANLIQVYTGFVYAGPDFPRKICKHLVRTGTMKK